jgi:NAD(P)H-dependent FMN reductase
MKKILVVLGSAREGRAADKVANFVTEEIQALGGEVTIADLQKINMPFFNNPSAPMAETYSTTEASVLAWSAMVKESDAVLLLTPEYNKGTSAILKNAIDWLAPEWTEKPVAVIGYGWGGATFAIPSVVQSLGHVKANVQEETGSLFFMKSIGVDGQPIEGEAKVAIDSVLKTLVTA